MRAKLQLSLVVGAVLLAPSAYSQSDAGESPGSEPPGSTASRDAQPDPESQEDPARLEARELFLAGVKQVKEAQWATALASFEASNARFTHATTVFNIAACERAMGRYTRARASFERALELARSNPETLAVSLRTEAKGYVVEANRILARIDVTISQVDARIAVDGRPLARDGAEYVAGLSSPGLGAKVPGKRFRVVVDPGNHVFTVSRKGYEDAVVRRTFRTGEKVALPLKLDRLPATLQVSSSVRDAIVTIDGKDFGPAPISLLRPAGSYRVSVRRDGFEPYQAKMDVQPGEQANLRATLVREKDSLTSHWWFWAGAAAVVVGGALATYALTRPDPEPEPYDSGSTGWLVRPLNF